MNEQQRSRTALLLSSIVPLLFAGGFLGGFLTPALLGLGGILAAVALGIASRYREEYRASVHAKRADPLAASRGYLEFHARRAGAPPGVIVCLVWMLWCPTFGFITFLCMHAVWDFATHSGSL